MAEVVAIRMEENFLSRIDQIGKEESADRSTVIRKLIQTGYKEMLKDNSALLYKAGKITLSEAARRAGLTLWDMEHYLVDSGFKSDYSLEDLQREMALLKQKTK